MLLGLMGLKLVTIKPDGFCGFSSAVIQCPKYVCFDDPVLAFLKDLVAFARADAKKPRGEQELKTRGPPCTHGGSGCGRGETGCGRACWIAKLDEAIEEFNKAVELTPGYVTAWNNLGDTLEQKKEFKGAIEAYEESLSLAPGNKIAETRLEEIRRRQGRLGLLD